MLDSKEAVLSIKSLLREDTVIICLQNGYKAENIVKEIVDCKVLRAITNQGVIFEEPGKIRTPFNSYIKIEESDITKKIVECLKDSGLNPEISTNIEEDVWKKMLINCIINPLTAILKVPNDGIIPLQSTMKSILDEVKLVLDKEGIIFSDEEYENARKEHFSKNHSSMFQDISKGKKTEIDYMNGAVVDLGRKHNVPTPINEVLVEMIHFLEVKG